MLVLSRRKGEKININHDIEIYLLEINGNQVKLGIKAPPEISVHRNEIYKKIYSKNETILPTIGETKCQKM